MPQILESYKLYLHNSTYKKDTIITYFNEIMQYHQWCDLHLLDPIQDHTFESYDIFLLDEFSTATYSKKRAALIDFARYCLLNEWIPGSSPLIDRFKIEVFPQPYSEHEVLYALTVANHVSLPLTTYRNLLIIELALHGLTENEILSIPVSGIDLSGQIIVIKKRRIPFYPSSMINSYYAHWLDLRKEKDPDLTNESPLLTTIKNSISPLRRTILMSTLKFLSETSDLEFSIARFNATYVLRLLKMGYSHQHIHQLLPTKLKSISNHYFSYIENHYKHML